MTADKGKAREEDDLDDLDDLDDVLEQFNNAPSAALSGKASSNFTSNTATAYDRAMQNNDDGAQEDEDGADDDDELEAMFASELAKEMEKMLGGLKPSNDNVDDKTSGKPDTGKSEDEPESEEERQFRETFEKILANSMKGESGGESENGDNDNGDVDLEQLSKLMNGLGGPGGLPDFDAFTKSAPTSSTSTKGKAAQPQPPRTFEETIKATMSRLNESEASHQNKAKSADDPLAALMAQMEALGAGGAGFPGMNGKDGDEELPELLDGLMDQLMSKELLYEPITELRTKYPEYLNSGEGVALPESERQRYKKQNDIVNSIAAIFEDPKYSDTDKDARERVSKLMQEMQDAGAPPKHLLGELGPAMALNPDGTPNVDPEQCIIS